MKKQHVMIDLETLGTRPGCVILEMAAVGFDEAGGEYEVYESGIIELVSATAKGLHVDAETLQWWSDKSALTSLLNGKRNFKVEVGNLIEFVGEILADKGSVWCWGGSFDFPVLKDAIWRCDGAVPWEHWQERCARTLCKTLGVSRRGDTRHRALDDAMSQIIAVQVALAEVSWLREISAEGMKG